MGAIRDVTNSFDIPFFIGGISFITSALMHFFLMWITRRESINAKKSNSKTETVISPSTLDVWLLDCHTVFCDIQIFFLFRTEKLDEFFLYSSNSSIMHPHPIRSFSVFTKYLVLVEINTVRFKVEFPILTEKKHNQNILSAQIILLTKKTNRIACSSFFLFSVQP